MPPIPHSNPKLVIKIGSVQVEGDLPLRLDHFMSGLRALKKDLDSMGFNTSIFVGGMSLDDEPPQKDGE